MRGMYSKKEKLWSFKENLTRDDLMERNRIVFHANTCGRNIGETYFYCTANGFTNVFDYLKTAIKWVEGSTT